MEPIDGKPIFAPKPPQRGLYNPVPPWEKQAVETSARRPVPWVSRATSDLLAKWVVVVNRAVCGLLALWEVWRGTKWSEALGVGGGFLPGVVCLLILYARTELRIIDMDALEQLAAKSEEPVQKQGYAQGGPSNKEKGKGRKI